MIPYLSLELYMHSYPASLSAISKHSNIKTIHLTVRQDDLLKMPEHPGSMLRGAFGVALRSLTCVTDLSECRLCPLKQHCKFPHIFETPALQTFTVQAVNPYVIHVPIATQTQPNKINSDTITISKNPDEHTFIHKKGDVWQFGMTLMGAAITETALIINAWRLALETGLGTHAPYHRATLIQASCEGHTLYSLPQLSLNSKNIAVLRQNCLSNTESVTTKITDTPTQLTLQFLTPFRYQQDNRIVSHPDKLDSTTFLASIYNRIRLCQKNHSPNQEWDIGYDSYHEFKDDIASLTIDTDISANCVSRRSNRQQRKMQLYGLQGAIYLTGDYQTISRLLPALRLGEQIHIGKNTTMGLGQYQLLFTPALN